MFTGSVPKPVVEQILRVVPIEQWGDIFVCCSGSFRVDKAVKDRFPSCRVHSNDVSLLSVCLGNMLIGRPTPVVFTNRLEFVNQYLDHGMPASIPAAVLVALDMAKYSGNSRHSQSHFDHYLTNFRHFHEKAIVTVTKFALNVQIDTFFAGDFRAHTQSAKTGGGVVSFPPTYKGGYERLYKFIDTNTQWPSPQYDMWNPKDMPAWLDELADQGIPFCVFSDQVLEKHTQVARYYSNLNKPIYIYASEGSSSIRRAEHRVEQFKYTPVDPSKLTKDTKVEVIAADSAQMNYLKDIYLSKHIHHATGQFNYLVFLDGALAGGFIFSRSKFGDISELYMLSDFSVTRENRISKLIALLATSRDVARAAEKKLLTRIKTVFTTAFTDKPVSMKYRGIYELHARKEGFLNYKSKIRDKGVQEIYSDWFKSHASKGGK